MYRAILLSLTALSLVACSAVVTPPEAEEPRAVVLLEHARHTTLLLTAADQSRVRYAYGDWAWYVDLEQNLWTGTGALFGQSEAALGRLQIEPEQPGEQLASAIGVAIDQAHTFNAEAEKVDALLQALEQQFQASSAEPYFSIQRNLAFVPHPRPYTFAYNSNHMVADWLRELGFEVNGNPATGNWQVNR